ncbi:MAG: phosphoribosyltransferase [Bacteroidetes bacterium]|nr:phosphoribosyltransferase [Bacteroidota bacterium]MBL7893216.1 phosphoribosyltransferase [Bacteroidia bacterium]
MTETKTLILNADQIRQKTDRIAYQIYENNFEEKEIIMAGIAPKGYILAQRLAKKLEEIAKIKITLVEITVNKDNPLQDEVKLSIKPKEFSGKVVILVDDVLNSGKTLVYGLAPFLNVPVKRITTAVLVDRNHNRYPIKADFVGLSLATTLQEHISVELAKSGKEAVYLM